MSFDDGMYVSVYVLEYSSVRPSIRPSLHPKQTMPPSLVGHLKFSMKICLFCFARDFESEIGRTDGRHG